MKELQYLNFYFKKYSGRLTLGLIITIIATIFKIIVPKIIGDIVALLQSPAKNIISLLKSSENKISGVVKALGNKQEQSIKFKL